MTTSGLDIEQFRKVIIRPTLSYLDLDRDDRAENLIIGTGAVESGFRYLHQINGPALGIFQMEPFTHDSLWEDYLNYKPSLADKIRKLTSRMFDQPSAQELVFNLYYQVAMCRIKYRTIAERLPKSDDIWAMAQYWKHYYNSDSGKGNVEDFFVKYPL